MINGTHLWSKQYTNDMISLFLDGRSVYTYPNLPSSMYEVLQSAAARFPNKVALVDDNGIAYTYQDFMQKVDTFSSYLSNCMKITKGCHVAVLLYNSIEFCVSFLSLCKLGGIIIPLSTKFKKSEVLSLLAKTNAHTIICDSDFVLWFQNADFDNHHLVISDRSVTDYGFSRFHISTAPPVDELILLSDPAIIMFTSGTTAQSKGVLLKNYNIMHAIVTYQRLFGITSFDTSIIPIPLYHITGLIALLGVFLYANGTLFLHKYFDAPRILETMRQEKITFFHASPTVFFLLLQHSDVYSSLPHLKMLACGSGSLPTKNLKQIHHWLPHSSFHTIYGLTETSSPATIFPGDVSASTNIGSSGLPIPGSIFKIVDEYNCEVSAYVVGEIAIQGTMVLSQYYNFQTNTLNDDGWLKTGDLGYFNEDGFLFVVDRIKDMINRGGEKIWCSDVENELYHIPGIKVAAVVGIPDDVYGEVAAAVVTLTMNSNLTEALIQTLLKPQLAKYKIPTKILILKEIPVTTNLKIDKVAIKKLFNTL